MLTASEIINLAVQVAKVPGMTTQAGQFMNARLLQLALDQDMDIIRRTTTVNVITGQAAYDLPVNYLRMREAFYNINGSVFWLIQLALKDYDQLNTNPGLTDYPYYYSTDIGTTPPTLLLYPPPSLAFPLTIRYMDSLVEIVDPPNSQVIPWFQDQSLLIDMVSENLMNISDDTRVDAMFAKNDDKFRRLIQMSNDHQNRATVVEKDPRAFRSVRQVRPTKLQGGW
ncbi:MAG: hypothetical protein V4621_08060 [Pseudomonadota bacterium]